MLLKINSPHKPSSCKIAIIAKIMFIDYNKNIQTLKFITKSDCPSQINSVLI